MNKEFDLDYQYKLYLQRVALTENKMHPEQKKQLRQTFFGACGQMLILLRDDLALLEDDQAVKTMQNMLDQVGDYFLKEKGESN